MEKERRTRKGHPGDGFVPLLAFIEDGSHVCTMPVLLLSVLWLGVPVHIPAFKRASFA